MDFETSYQTVSFNGEHYHIWAKRRKTYLKKSDICDDVKVDYIILSESSIREMTDVRHNVGTIDPT